MQTIIGKYIKEKKSVPMLLVMYVVAKPTFIKLSDRGKGRLAGGAANIHPKIGSVGMMANAAMVIS